MAGNFPMNVYNNFIVNNVSTHEGGGIGINDAPNVRVYNNTIMKNLTTATAVTSNGCAGPGRAVDLAQQRPAAGHAAGRFAALQQPAAVQQHLLGQPGGYARRYGHGDRAQPVTPMPIIWDLGVADGPGLLAPTNSIVQQNAGATRTRRVRPTSRADPSVVTTYDVAVTFNTWRNNPAFLGAILISADLPPNLMGDYHLAARLAGRQPRRGAASSGVQRTDVRHRQPGTPGAG